MEIKISNLEKQIAESLNTRDITEIEEYVKSSLHEHSLSITNLMQKVNVVSEQLKSLESCVKEIKANCAPTAVTSETNNTKESSFTHKPGGNMVIKPLQQMESNPTSMFDAYCSDFITNPLRDKLAKFLTEQKFLPKKGRIVITYGANYDDLNNVSSPATTELPEILKKVKSLVPEESVNSVVLTRYTGNDNHLPQHSDSTSQIKPGSTIYTISTGDTCDIKFRYKARGTEKSLTVSDSSMYSMTLTSLYYWTHRLDKGSLDPSNVICSLTFRTVGRYQNFVLIVGDSNTRHINFHDTPGKRSVLDKEITGTRYPAYQIVEIDPISCIGYKNIIFHVGINDLKDRPNMMNGQVNVNSVFTNWIEKLITIRKLCPYSNFFVSPILPTKVRVLNNRAVRSNNLIGSRINPFWVYLDCNSFLNVNTNLLDDNYGCHMSLINGRIHLASYGISKLALIFRETLLTHKRYRIENRIPAVRNSNMNNISPTYANKVSGGKIVEPNASKARAHATSNRVP